MFRQYSFVGILTLLLTGLQVWSGRIAQIEEMPRPDVDPVIRNQMLGLMDPGKNRQVLGEQNTLLDIHTLNGISSFFQGDTLSPVRVATRTPTSKSNQGFSSDSGSLDISIEDAGSSGLNSTQPASEAKVWQGPSHAPLVIEPIREPAREISSKR